MRGGKLDSNMALFLLFLMIAIPVLIAAAAVCIALDACFPEHDEDD
jgi:hypothetical protein